MLNNHSFYSSIEAASEQLANALTKAEPQLKAGPLEERRGDAGGAW